MAELILNGSWLLRLASTSQVPCASKHLVWSEVLGTQLHPCSSQLSIRSHGPAAIFCGNPKPHSGFSCHLLLKSTSGSSFLISTFTQVSDCWTHSYFLKKYQRSVPLGIDVNMSMTLSLSLLMPMPSEFKKLKQGIVF